MENSQDINELKIQLSKMSLVNRSLYYDNFKNIEYKYLIPKLSNDDQLISDFPILAIYYIIGNGPEYIVKRWLWIYSKSNETIGTPYKIDILPDNNNPKIILLSINGRLRYKVERLFRDIDKNKDTFYVKDYYYHLQLPEVKSKELDQTAVSISYIKILPQGPITLRKEIYINKLLRIVIITNDQGTTYKSMGKVYYEFLIENPNIVVSELLFDDEYRKLIRINKLQNQVYENIWSYYKPKNGKNIFSESWTIK